MKDAVVCHLMSQGVLERVLDLGEQTRLVDKLCGLQVCHTAAQIVLAHPCDLLKEGEWHVLADHGSRLQEALLFRRQPANASGENRLSRGRYWPALQRLRRTIGASLAGKDVVLSQHLDTFFEEQGVPFGAFGQHPLEWIETPILP